MAMHHGHDLRPGAIDLAVDVALDEALALVSGRRLAVRAPFDQVGRGDERRRPRARHEEVLGALVAPRADVAVSVEHAMVGEDAASRDEIVDELLAGSGLLHLVRISLKCGEKMQRAAVAVIETA